MIWSSERNFLPTARRPRRNLSFASVRVSRRLGFEADKRRVPLGPDFSAFLNNWPGGFSTAGPAACPEITSRDQLDVVARAVLAHEQDGGRRHPFQLAILEQLCVGLRRRQLLQRDAGQTAALDAEDAAKNARGACFPGLHARAICGIRRQDLAALDESHRSYGVRMACAAGHEQRRAWSQAASRSRAREALLPRTQASEGQEVLHKTRARQDAPFGGRAQVVDDDGGLGFMGSKSGVGG